MTAPELPRASEPIEDRDAERPNRMMLAPEGAVPVEDLGQDDGPERMQRGVRRGILQAWGVPRL